MGILAPDLRGIALDFSPLSMILAMGLSRMTFIILKCTYSISILLRVFMIYECWILWNAFCAYIEMILWFLSLLLFMWHISCWLICRYWTILATPGINSTWSWCIILFMYCSIQFVNILVRIFFFIYVLQGYWPVIFFSDVVLVWFWYQENGTKIKWVWKSCLLLYFLEKIVCLSLSILSLISPKPVFPAFC